MPYTAYENLAPNSRIWIYQTNALVSDAVAAKINATMQEFAEQWTSHNRALTAWGAFLHNCFLVFAVDETMAGASGCSIDKSVNFIKNIEAEYQLDFFDRWAFSYKDKNGKIQIADRDAFAELYAQGAIDDKTAVFNNLVQTKADFESKWCVALEDSWHKNFVQVF